MDFYSRAFGLGIADRIDFESFTLVYLRNAEADFELELTINKGRTEPYALGDGYGHIAFVVEDLDAEHSRLTEAGLAPRKLVDFRNDGQRVARFFFIADPDGYQIEVIARGGRFHPSIGSKTFRGPGDYEVALWRPGQITFSSACSRWRRSSARSPSCTGSTMSAASLCATGEAAALDLVAVAATYNVNPRAQLFARVDNLLDETYEQPLAFAGRPRAVLVGVRARR